MILGLTALGEGRMPFRTRVEASLSHVAGAVVGGTLVVTLAWLLATPIRTLLPGAVSAALVVVVAAAAVAIDLRWLPGASRGKQVPSPWLGRYGPRRAYALYGFHFGLAFSTLRPYAIVYPVVAALALLASFPVAVAGGAIFGVGRTALIGPGSLKSVFTSRVLYHGRWTRRIWTVASVTLTIGLAVAAVASSVA